MEEGFEHRTSHAISGDLEANPDFYHIKIVADRTWALKHLKKGGRLPVLLNMENYNVYIGSDHLNMQYTQGIPADNFCAGYVSFDRKTKKAIVVDLTDWREGNNDINGVKKAIETAFDRDIGVDIFNDDKLV
jgi:hypothetical protein